jgi:rubrerythrin
MEELIRAVRLDLSAEQEAVHLYMAHAEATDNPLAKKVFIDIANEERVHIGEFARLLSILTGDEDMLLTRGAQEVDEMALELSLPPQEVTAEATKPEVDEMPIKTTIGSLKK